MTYPVCVCVCTAGLSVWFRLFEVAVVRGCGGHETIKVAALVSVPVLDFLFIHVCLRETTQTVRAV